MITGLNHVDTFLAKMAPTAQAIGGKWKIPPSVIIAQAALETGWGQEVKGNAYFGIKQGASTGEAIRFTTQEIIDGQKVTLVDRFRAYRSMQEATHAYAEFLHDTPRYQKALRDTSDSAKFVEALQEAGYASDPRYAEKLKHIMQRYQLTAYDDIQQTTQPPDAPEPAARSGTKRSDARFGGISALAKYLIVPQSRPGVRPQSLEVRQTNAGEPTRLEPTPAATEAEPGATGSRTIAPSLQSRQANSAVPEVLSHQGLPQATFSRLLWEQIRQFTWDAAWGRPPSDKPSDDASDTAKSSIA